MQMCHLDKYYRKERYTGALSLAGTSVPDISAMSKVTMNRHMGREKEWQRAITYEHSNYHKKELSEHEGWEDDVWN